MAPGFGEKTPDGTTANDLLQADPLPTFVLDQGDGATFTKLQSRVVFQNEAFDARYEHHRAVASGVLEWATSAKPPAEFQDGQHVWQQFGLGSQLRVVRCIISQNDKGETPQQTDSIGNETASHQRTVVRTKDKSDSGAREHIENASTLDKTSIDWTDLTLPYITLNTTPFIQDLKAVDWSRTPLGPISGWPRQLRAFAFTLMTDANPSVLFGGDQLTLVYNEPYKTMLGSKVETAMGATWKSIFSEVWDDFRDDFHKIRTKGESVCFKESLVVLLKGGILEEGYYNFSLLPIMGDDGVVVGMYQYIMNVTR
jgi:PAS domain-containing protein